jgi:hypothetical protein
MHSKLANYAALLNLATYFSTAISFPAMIPSRANSGEGSESQNPFKFVEAGD